MALLQTAEVPGIGITLVVGGVLVACTLAAAPLALHLVRLVAPRGETLEPRWGWRELLAVAGCALALLLVAGWVLAALTDEGAVPDVRLELVLTAAVLGIASGLAIALARATTPSGARALGLRPDALPRSVAGAWLAYALFAPGLVGVNLVWSALLRAGGVSELEQPIARQLGGIAAGDRPLAFLLGVLVLPLCEELLFRGFLQTSLERALKPVGALCVSSVLFAALHGQVACVPIFALSLVLGGVMLRTRNVLACWAVHALHNGIMFAFLWLVPEALRNLSGEG